MTSRVRITSTITDEVYEGDSDQLRAQLEDSYQGSEDPGDPDAVARAIEAVVEYAWAYEGPGRTADDAVWAFEYLGLAFPPVALDATNEDQAAVDARRDLIRDLGQQRQLLRGHARDITGRLRAAVVAEAASTGVSEYVLAELAQVDRMTIRKWLAEDAR